ncbi:MAG: glycosyltransferase family 2 protein [Henriciella sp.]
MRRVLEDDMGPLPESAVPDCLSIIVPTYNEEESVALLAEQVADSMESIGCAYELIFVDDGSTDGTAAALKALADADPHIRVIEFRRNFGKAAALDAGFQVATGDIVFTMDADLQDDPAEIPNFLAKLAEGYDIVSGWKHVRHDPLDKTLPSKLFNRVVSRLSGVKLNDFNCGFKAYRNEAIKDLTLYGELHRFIPVLLHWDGFKVGEIPVNHRARQFGKSKYGMGRLFKGALDFLGVMLNTRYATRPLHVFGGVGMLFGAIGATALLYLSALWLVGAGPIGNRPLLFFGMLMVMTGFQFITIGLLGEFIQRQSAQPKRRFTIRTLRNLENNSVTTDELITELKRASARLRAGTSTWQPQPSAQTQLSDTSASTPTRTRFTG